MSISENTMNVDQPAIKKTKRDDLTAKPQGLSLHGTKRAALGTINGNTRKQPSRAAKQSSKAKGYYHFNDENAKGQAGSSGFCIPSSAALPGFSIHVDDAPPMVSGVSLSAGDISEFPLASAVTTLQRPAELENVGPFVIDDESPMVLDISSRTEPDVEVIEDDEEPRIESVIEDVPEYAEDIFQYLREAELKNRPKPGYMKKQPDITASMRSILVDWLVEVSEEYRLHNETLYLAVSYIDRFLSQMSVLRAKLQLVGTASMFLAAKFEEIYPPEVTEFVYITDDTYTTKQVLRMEHLVLKVLSFDVATPTINCFLGRFLKAAQTDKRTEDLARYLCELTLQEGDFMKYLPSTIAASSICLALHTFHQQSWTSLLAKYTEYQLEDILPCVQDMHKIFVSAPSQTQQAVREKYKASKYSNVSLTQALTNPPTL